MAEGAPVNTGESVNIYQEHEDPLSLAVAVGSQEPKDVDWRAVLEQVGIMRDGEGRPMEGANTLGATALQMISSASAVEALQRAGEDATQGISSAVGRLENSGSAVADDLRDRSRQIEEAAESVSSSSGRLVTTSEDLGQVARKLEPVADELGRTLAPHKLDQLSEAGRDISRGARAQGW